MKDKIMAQLVTKYPGVSKKFLGVYADKIALKLTEESEIEGVVNELDNLPVSIPDLAAAFQQEGDRRVTEATEKKPKQKETPKKEEPNDTQATQADEPPSWAKGLIEKINRLESEKQLTTIKGKVADKLKDVPASYWSKRTLPEKEEDLEAFITEVQSDYTAFQQELNDKGLMMMKPPKNGTAGSNNKATADEIKAITDKILIK